VNRSRRELLKSRRGDRVKRKNLRVLPLAVSFAYFFSVKEIGIELIIKFRNTFIYSSL